MRISRHTLLSLTLTTLFACGSTDDGTPPAANPGGSTIPDDETPTEPGNDVAVEPSAGAQQAFDSLSAALKSTADTSVDALLSKHAVEFRALEYSPSEAAHLDLIQASSMALSDAEMSVLEDNGFVISPRQAFPSFAYGYVSIYAEDLPLYVSADSILNAVHRSYDDVLKLIETNFLIDELDALLGELRAAVADGDLEQSTRQDLDFYLSVAHSLLQNSAQTPSAGADGQQVRQFFANAVAADGMGDVELFGVPRTVDFSQFKPRGHYMDSPDLERYFRAMMWLGRVDFRLLETKPNGSQVLHRRQFDATVAMAALFGEQQWLRFERINSVIEAFVGKADYMTPPEVASLLEDLGGAETALAASDETVAKAIVDGGYGEQLIASHFMLKGPGSNETLPLNRSFLVFGQRYVLDSHVFSNVVWDRTEAQRMMPNPLDAAFAALANDAAAPLLKNDLEAYQYAGNLESVRTVADAHGDEFWEENLYNLWLGALRAMSPNEAASDGSPTVAQTEPWSRRVLNTQLASWAELRHDTILYAKQSYTTSDACEFPDAYVEPYPEVFAALMRFAERGERVAELLPETDATYYDGQESVPLGQGITSYFQTLRTTLEMLHEMATLQQDGLPYEQKHLDFINRTVDWHPERLCGAPPMVQGWYADLFFDPWVAGEYDPTIADVHTQPTEPGGAPVGKVLHVGTGNAELLVVSIDTCEGPKAYVGLASSYYEHTTRDYLRLTDEEWREVLAQDPPPRPSWMQDLLTE